MRVRNSILYFGIYLTPLFILQFVVGGSIYANNAGYPHLHFQQIQDGLSRSGIRTLIEDSKGFLWVGTRGGLNRFDGVNFKIFEMDESDSTAIPDNRINDLCIDSEERLWIATYHGLVRYVEETEDFSTIYKEAKEGEEKNLDALKLFEDRNNKLWIGTQSGLFILNSENKKLVRSDIASLGLLERRTIFSIEEAGNLMYFGTDKGLYFLNKSTQQLKRVVGRNGDKIPVEIHDIVIDSENRIWVATNGRGLLRINQEISGDWLVHSYFKGTHPKLNSRWVFKLYEDSRGRVWAGSESSALNLYIPEQDSFITFSKDLSQESALKAKTVWEIYEDASGRLYAGTNDQGIFFHDPFAINFNPVDPRYGLRLKASTVTSFLEVGTDIWVGTDGGGISIWNRKNNDFSFLGEEQGLGSMGVMTMFKDSRGVIWTGNWNGGLNRYNPSTGRFKTYKHTSSQHSIGSNHIRAIDEDRDGNLWITSWEYGVSRYDRIKDEFFNIGYVRYNDDFLAHKMTYDLEIDDLNGDIWVATVLGIDRITMLDDSSFAIKHFRYNKDKPNSLSGINALCIFEDHKNRIWVGTNNGLNLFDRKTETFKRFSSKDGLPGSDIKEIIQDNQHTIWIGTTKGLAKMIETKAGFIIESYFKTDGLLSNEFAENGAFKAASGEIFFGGINGFNYFDPRGFQPNPYPPKIQFTGLKILNKEVKIGKKNSPLNKSLNSIEHLHLNQVNSAFTISYIGINMTRPEENKYAYKLEGFDKNWNHVGDKLEAKYTNLDPGEYRLLIRAENRDGIDSPEPRSLKITVSPPWWESIWAKFIFIFGPLALTIAFIQIRFSIIQAQKRNLARQVEQQTAELLSQKNEIEVQAAMLEKINKQKNKLFSIIAHDLRSPISALKGITSLLNPDILDAEDLGSFQKELKSKVDNIGKVMLNLLDWSKSQLEGERLNVQNFDLSIICDEICQMYQSAAFEKGVSLINCISLPLMVHADQNQIRIIFQNLVGNALKFTRAEDEIRIDFEVKSEEEVEILVSDTGLGMSEEQKGMLFDIKKRVSSVGTHGETGIGLGLLLVKEFVEKNGGQIRVESQQGVGSCFHFGLKRAQKTCNA
ncbi:MAG: ATP-binding protein [Bacteroidia bacterium]|nr:ATP-binding protein [Bacteroidia bacterium]